MNTTTITIALEGSRRIKAGDLCKLRDGGRGVIASADFETMTVTFERVGFWRWWRIRLRNLWLAVRNDWCSVMTDGGS